MKMIEVVRDFLDSGTIASHPSASGKCRVEWIRDAMVRMEGLCIMIDALHEMMPVEVNESNIDELAKRLCDESQPIREVLVSKNAGHKKYKPPLKWDDLTDHGKEVWRIIVRQIPIVTRRSNGRAGQAAGDAGSEGTRPNGAGEEGVAGGAHGH